MICVLETAASYGPKWALVLDEPVYKHGSGVADRLVMTSAEQRSDLDQETARIRASGRVLRLQGEDSARRLLITIWWYRDENLLRANIDAIRILAAIPSVQQLHPRPWRSEQRSGSADRYIFLRFLCPSAIEGNCLVEIVNKMLSFC
jgi:hypothetical protein